jgi:hypothetical protein
MSASGHRGLVELRTEAQDAITAENWIGLLAMESRLRRDRVWWHDIWAPACAMAAARLNRRSPARSYLEEAIAAGFSQPELFHSRLSQAFRGDPEWARLAAAMAENVPAPAVTLHEWPAVAPAAPLALDRLPADREELLRARLPALAGSAWDTAVSLLRWVSDRWQHANDHVASRDAVTILDRVDAGQRFACVEYTAVLSQALNTVRIPSRAVVLRQADYHTGMAKNHVVSEAWIDELGAWVVLDGQNGLYWVDGSGVPLGIPALQDLCRAGHPAPRHRCVGSRQVPDQRAAYWFTHFRHMATTGAGWEPEAYVPTLMTDHVAECEVLLPERDHAYPDLSQVGVGVVNQDGQPALRFHSPHPFSSGFLVTDRGRTWKLAPAEPWSLPGHPTGEHHAAVAAATPYAILRSHRLTYRTASRLTPEGEPNADPQGKSQQVTGGAAE